MGAVRRVVGPVRVAAVFIRHSRGAGMTIWHQAPTLAL
ncbi:hypothetical protein RR42_m4085 [Cupriavidus basilensis]|uniref:Uncharacterized protein n=1 Tax=Cupriavidus basilensis TaxID=68895 RepID=A0A0C4YEZ6_9BURK|nr:hypothetical protein RR42_m4085 [Cupriavidus basilensis]